jgi:hypothetical protein
MIIDDELFMTAALHTGTCTGFHGTMSEKATIRAPAMLFHYSFAPLFHHYQACKPILNFWEIV